MTRYVRMSTPSRSASARASALGRTLKPTTSAFDTDARLTSFSEIAPTPVWMTFTRTSGCWIFWSSDTAASTEPSTSPFTTRFRSWTPPACIWSKSVSRVGPVFACCASCSRRSRSPRTFASRRAWRSHGREGLGARRVEEGDAAAVVVDLVGADVLRDPAGLGLDDGRLADRVQERRLAVVDVAHDRDHGRPLLEVLRAILEDLRLLVLVRDVLDRDLAVHLG